MPRARGASHYRTTRFRGHYSHQGPLVTPSLEAKQPMAAGSARITRIVSTEPVRRGRRPAAMLTHAAGSARQLLRVHAHTGAAWRPRQLCASLASHGGGSKAVG